MIGGHAGAQQNVMVTETTYDVLCGQYTVTVQELDSQSDPPRRTAPAPERPPEPTHDCHRRNVYGDHGSVDGDKVELGAKMFCESHGNHIVKEGEFEKVVAYPPDGEGKKGDPRPLGHLDAWYSFAVKWDYRNCGEDDEPVTIGDPEGLTSCENLILNNYKKCESLPSWFLGQRKGFRGWVWLTRFKVTTGERAAGLKQAALCTCSSHTNQTTKSSCLVEVGYNGEPMFEVTGGGGRGSSIPGSLTLATSVHRPLSIVLLHSTVN